MYVNFAPVWSSVRDVLATFASDRKADALWTVLFAQLPVAFDNAERSRWWIKPKSKCEDSSETAENLYSEFVLCDPDDDTTAVNRRVNHFNYRLQLLKTLAGLPHPDMIEAHNRALAELLFRYLDGEYARVDSHGVSAQCLRDRSGDEDEVVCRRKDAVVTLVAILNVFARFTNAQSSAHHERLHQLYLTFLTHHDSTLQRAALDCLLAFHRDRRRLASHRETLADFFDDRKFRDALAALDLAAMTAADRDALLPVLMRVLYGRMRSKTGKETGGKEKAGARRGVVVRFVAGVDARHLTAFVAMATEPFDGGDDRAPLTVVGERVAARCAETLETVPLRKQHGLIGTVKTLIATLGTEMPHDVYSRLLRVLVCALRSGSALLASEDLCKRFAPALRNLNKQATEQVALLLRAWPASSAISADQVDAMFDACVWGQMSQLLNESGAEPTASLKLLAAFARRARYLPLLVKTSSPGTQFGSPVDALVAVLTSPKTGAPVAAFIVDTFAAMVTTGDDDDDEAMTAEQRTLAIAAAGHLSVCLPPDALTDRHAAGVAILHAHVARVVAHFARRLRNRKTATTARELELLSALAEHTDACDAAALADIAAILIDSARRAVAGRRVCWTSVTSSLRTLAHVTRAPDQLPRLAPLLSKVTERQARAQLVAVVERACRDDDDWRWTADVVRRLNAWEPRFVDEIDFDARLTALADVLERLGADDAHELFADGCRLFLPVMHCCLHAIQHLGADISLRESVSRVLDLVVRRVDSLFALDVERGCAAYRVLVTGLILPAVQRGLRSAERACRHESLRVLAVVVRVFPDEPTLRGLSALTNASNPDDDVLENLRHIQAHRQARALRRLAKRVCPSRQASADGHQDKLKPARDDDDDEDKSETANDDDGSETHSAISQATAVRYVLPIATQALYADDSSAPVNYVCDACLELVSSCCAIMTWSTLKRFIAQTSRLLDRKSRAVDVLVAALEAFPFDLSRAKLPPSDVVMTAEAVAENVVEKKCEHLPAGASEVTNYGTEAAREVKSVNNDVKDDVEGAGDDITDEARLCDDVSVIGKDITDDLQHTGDVTDELEVMGDGDDGEGVQDDSDETMCDDIIGDATAPNDDDADTKDADLMSSTILSELTRIVIPKLREALGSKGDETQHKRARTGVSSEQCTSKLPLAVAIVSIVKKMPAHQLRTHLTGVVLKVVDYLRHKKFDVREAARSTICRVACALGPAHLHVIIAELRAGLVRGFHKHVLIRTAAAVLQALQPATNLAVGDLDHCLSAFGAVFQDDLFGSGAAERKVDQLRAKTPEARGRSRAFAAYRTLAALASRDRLAELLGPFRTQAERTSEHGVKRVIRVALDEIGQGLLENSGLQVDDLLTLVYGLLSDDVLAVFSIDDAKKRAKPETEETKQRRPASCLLLSSEPTRVGAKPPAKRAASNLHLMVEFALQLLHQMLKRQPAMLDTHAHMLHPIVPPLARCVDAPERQTCADAVRCLTRLVRAAAIPAVHDEIDGVVRSLFRIVKDNANGVGNQELAQVGFKCLSALCASEHALADTQLRTLLAYAESDLHDTRRQTHAFALLKQIMRRGVRGDDMTRCVDEVRRVAVQSHVAAARAQARQLYLFYVTTTPLTTRQLTAHVHFAVRQLGYEHEDGRLSAMELVSSVVEDFPVEFVQDRAGVVFVPVAALLVNDESAQCRRTAGALIRVLLTRVEQDVRNRLFDITAQWYGHDETTQQRLAAMLISIFAEVEKKGMQRRMNKVFPLIQSCLERETESKEGVDTEPRASDHSIFYHLSALLSLLRHCDVAAGNQYHADLAPLYHLTQRLLLHAHDWVRYVSAQIFGSAFAVGAFDNDRLRALAPLFCEQLEAEPLAPAGLADQTVKNLLHALRTLDAADDQERTVSTSLTRMRTLAKREQANRPKDTTKRSAVLKLCAAFAVSVERPERFLRLLLEPVCRCVTASATHGEHEIDAIVALRALATEVLDEVKQRVGAERFTEAYAKIARELGRKRKERKRERELMLVADPAKAAANKVRKQERTKQQRKRKIAMIRPEYAIKLGKAKKTRTG